MKKRTFRLGTWIGGSVGIAARFLALYAVAAFALLYYSQVWSWVTGNPDDSLNGKEAAIVTAIVLLSTIVFCATLVLFIAALIRVTNRTLKKYETKWEE